MHVMVYEKLRAQDDALLLQEGRGHLRLDAYFPLKDFYLSSNLVKDKRKSALYYNNNRSELQQITLNFHFEPKQNQSMIYYHTKIEIKTNL